MSKDLTKDQWKAVAEVLASYLDSACVHQDDCVSCRINCPIERLRETNRTRAHKDIWISIAKSQVCIEGDK